MTNRLNNNADIDVDRWTAFEVPIKDLDDINIVVVTAATVSVLVNLKRI